MMECSIYCMYCGFEESRISIPLTKFTVRINAYKYTICKHCKNSDSDFIIKVKLVEEKKPGE